MIIIKKIIMTFLIPILYFACSATQEIRVKGESEISPLWNRIMEEARWAQNAHNIQSWKVKVLDERTLIGSLDSSRLLPETDPYERQLILSLGAFSALAKMAAAREGWDLNATWIGPENWNSTIKEGIPLFRWELEEGALDDSFQLLDTISSATVKYAVEGTTLSFDTVKELENRYRSESVNFRFITSAGEVNRLKNLALLAFEKEMTFDPTRNESIINTRYGQKERDEKPYGITLLSNFRKNSALFIEFLAKTFPQSPEAYGKKAVNMFEKALKPASVLLLMTTEGNSPSIQFDSGKAMQSIWMEMIDRGFSLLPLSQGLQEYAAVKSEYDIFQSSLADEGETVQMLWALGTPLRGEFLRSPRLDIEDIALLK